jgi:glycosyltransferase involved in cell wall biosynthesis
MVNSPGFVAHVQVRGARQVDLIPNGADPRMFDPQADGSAFRQANRLEGRFVALYAGAHGMSNDLGIILQAADLLKDLPEVMVLLLGDGKEKPALMEQAVEMGLGNVLFLPPVSKAEMGQVLASADACIAILKPIPLYATVYPNKVFDYMAAGRPVVLAIDGVIREVVEEAEAGIFVSPGDPHALAEAIRCLVKDPDRGHSLGMNGRKYVETHFDRAVLAERLAHLFQEMHQG